MDYLNSPIQKDVQLKKLIEDTEEIIRNFREISDIIVDRIDQSDETMYNLGKRVIHSREEVFDPNSSKLGTKQIKFI